MPYEAGDISASTGMSKYIFESMKENLSGGFPDGPTPEVLEGWKKFSFSMAKGIVEYLKTDTGIYGIHTDIPAPNQPHTKTIHFSFENGASRTL